MMLHEWATASATRSSDERGTAFPARLHDDSRDRQRLVVILNGWTCLRVARSGPARGEHVP
jgi:hypothetical protein